MISMISDKIHFYSEKQNILIVSTGFVIFLLIGGFFFGSKIEELFQLDNKFYYTPIVVYSVIASLGSGMRSDMISYHLILDTIFLFLYSVLIAMIISWILVKAYKKNSILLKLNIVPILGGLFDLVENIFIIMFVLFYPTQINALVWIGSVFTLFKWLCLLICLFAIIIGITKLIYIRFTSILSNQS